MVEAIELDGGADEGMGAAAEAGAVDGLGWAEKEGWEADDCAGGCCAMV